MTHVANVIALNDGVIKGRTRLQKSVYFLEVLAAGYGFEFDYHHYGPFSEDLATATDDAVALGEIEFEWKQGTRLQPFAVYRAAAKPIGESALDLRRKNILGVLAKFDAVTLELAATADFLQRAGYEDAWTETSKRKPTKASSDRFAKAKELLSDLASLPN